MDKITLISKKLVFTIVLFFITFFGISQTTQTFSTSGTFTVPAGVTSIQVEAWGGGGAGGGATKNSSGAGGGAGGGYVKNTAFTVVPGTVYTINVGTGGVGGNSTGGAGGASWFQSSSTIKAVGGNGGISSESNNTTAAGASASTTGNIGWSSTFTYYGGAGGSGGLVGISGGGGGSSAGTLTNGNAPIALIGGLAPIGGASGASGSTADANGASSSTFGAGGAGGHSTSASNQRSGGNGSDGKVSITWTCPTSYSLSSTTVATSVCTSNSATVSVTAAAANLPIGIYTVTYNLTGANVAVGNTATMTVTTAGLGSFNTSALSNSGITAITITKLSSGGTTPNNCSSIISINNIANITVNTTPIILGTTPATIIGPGTVVLGATASVGTVSWYTAATGGSALGTGSSFTTPFITTTTTYYVETTNASCTSSPRIAVVATINLPEINILGNAISIIDGDTTPSVTDWTDFGSMETSTGIITKTYTIQNTGTSPLSIGAITISGTNAGDFTLTTSPSASIPAGGSTTFSVSFDPNTLGLKTAAISIVNDDTNENPYNFSIQGTGIQTFFDSDGDGVYDNFDIDDDNDGILDATEEINCNSSNGHKVDYKFLNETFGTGGRTPNFTAAYNATTTYCYEDGIVGTNTTECPSQSTKILDDGEYTVVSKITGTVASDPENIHGDLAWYNGEDHTTGDTNGRMAVFNASFTPGIFYETTITGILSNLPVTYSFWVLNIMAQSTFPGSILPNVTVEFYDLSNNLLTTFNTGDIGRCSGSTTDNTCSQGVWKQFTTSVNLGNVNAFTIRFKNNAPGGGGNDLALDDILISQTLCDLENDGVADMFDLDADNDGIEDVIEAGLGNLSNAKGKIDATWVDGNGNGLHDSSESVAALPALDSDGDGIPNYIDLDSDNDSLFDVDESGAGNIHGAVGYINGDGDINGDGVGDGPESETFRSKDINGDGITEGFGDGILDIYDYGTGATFNSQYGNLDQGIATGNPATTYLKDTDADGIPDYLDVMSNGSTFDIANTLLIYDYKTLDTNNNGIIDGTTDIDKDGILDIFDTNTAYFGSPRDIGTKLFLDFDGRNDYGQSTAILGGLANASLMAWINLNPAFSTDGVIIGQNNFQIRITAAKKLEAVVNGTTVIFNTTLNTSQWYNVGVIYDGSNIKLYLNGALVATQAKTGSISADVSLLTLGRDSGTSTKYFKGKIDEVRVFNSALTESQLQRMVYQEIQDTGSQVRGTIVPKNVVTSPASLPFTNLLRYYRMDTYKDDIIDDLTTPVIDLTGAKIYNHKNIHVQQAPMPFLTERNGSFATAVNSPTKEIRGEDIMEQDWSIVHVKHNITEMANNIDLGMLVDSGKNIVMNNDTKIQNDWYLKLDGKIDLVGMSQLVQTAESDLDVSSTGWIERDQQGQSNVYNYNYWSSPVSPINSLSNNNDYSVNEVFKDGTNVAVPTAINWVGGYDGAAGSPISLARYWLYKFDDYVNDYANWVQITENDLLRVGQGFTLKGSGSVLATQNYTFIGKPNNGSIATNTVGDDQLLLTGNPYPSALDADAFITDNINSLETFSSPSIDGTLYFWEHYASNNTHILRDYQGGYAVRNLTGGLAPSASGIDFISQSGTPSRGIPNRYIPVGQGFFVNGKIGSGGTVVFKNSQRGFHKENDALNSNVMYKIGSNDKKEKSLSNNDNDPVIKDTYKRIRLGFNSHNDYHRQVLLGFMNEKATSEMDYGYDGLNIDDFPNDMYFLNGENQLVIEGEGFFDVDASYPIGVKTGAAGKVKFMIDALENFDSSQPIFLYDDDTKLYHDIRDETFEVNLSEGEHHSRFSLRFKDKTLSLTEETGIDNEIKIAHSQSKNIIIINNKVIDTTVQEVTLFNSIGQLITTWKIENQGQYDIQLPIKKISSGVYIVKLKTSKGDLSKKIIIK
ncbi:choice-of-anchor D domain-containing protein [Flavobacterium rhamnosiphilum]|uniref:Choice-of-anchor D domain-containing protein n=1 Tax=Flavobacterium rhamnosiphilum TaxID=2541724 RepID=A0A4R5FBG5_9FLAO|nr:LamG-like jellyroll fold domain-containing protein [Flavobacterium rhamnosiphilum]TDE45909.1 choice-of-anchor D domain-containing protein [Flavobacterium rhamnosiphilum]